MNFPRFLALAIVSVLVVWSVAVYGGLPETIPTHFGISGEPDNWSPKSWVNWLLPVIIGALTVGIVFASSSVVRNRPGAANIPHKKRFLALPEEKQQPILDAMVKMLDWVAVEIALLFALIQMGSWMTASGGDGSPLILAGLAIVAMILVLTIATSRRVGRMIQAA